MKNLEDAQHVKSNAQLETYAVETSQSMLCENCKCPINEIWKTILGSEGYEVSSIGRVASTKFGKFNILNNQVNANGYFKVGMRRHTKRGEVSIHRLVAEAFIPNPENKPAVNHKNGIKSDNRVENLEWLTYAENAKHAWENGLSIGNRGEGHTHGKLSASEVLQIRDLYKSGIPQAVLVKKFNVSSHAIHSIVRRKSWKHI